MNSGERGLGRDLDRFLTELVHAQDVVHGPGRLPFDLALLAEWNPPESDGPPDLARAEWELERLHQSELSRLLREAAALQLSRGRWSGLLEIEPSGAEGLSSLLDEELGLARADGILAGRAVIEIASRCLCPDPERWPSTLSLAVASLAALPHPTGRLRLGQGLLEAGWVRDAQRVLRASLRRARAASRPGPGAVRGLRTRRAENRNRVSLMRALALARRMAHGSPS